MRHNKTIESRAWTGLLASKVPELCDVRLASELWTSALRYNIRKAPIANEITPFINLLEFLLQVNQWCESGIYLLASQSVDKCQSQEGAESALTDIEHFLESAEKNQLTELRNLHNQYEVVLSGDIKVSCTRWIFSCQNDDNKEKH